MATRKALVLVNGLFRELGTPTDKLDLAGNTTTDLAEGTNLYYTDSRARGSISVTDSGGDGSLSYNNTTGVITYVGPSASEVRAHFSVAAGSGLTYNNTTGVFGTSAIPNSQLANSSVVLGTTTVNLGDTKTTLTGFTELQSTTFNGTTFNAGTLGSANNISIGSGNIVFEGSTADANEITLTSADATVDRTITLPDATGTVALLSTLSATTSGTGYGSLSYNSTNGAFTYAVVTNANIRGAISVVDLGGDGALSYDNSTGVITYTGPSPTEVRSYFSVAVGSGLTYNSSTGEFGTSAIPNAQLANSSITIGSTSISLGGSGTTFAGLTSITSTTVLTTDGGFKIRNTLDNTKQIAFDASGVTPATIRTATFPDASGTLAFLETNNAFTGANTFTNASGQAFRQASTQDGVLITGRAGGTSSYAVTVTPATLTASRTATLPDASGTLALLEISNAFTGANTFTNASGQTFRQAATQDGILVTGRSGGTSSYAVTVTPTTLTASRTATFPDASGTVLLTSSTIPGGTFVDDTFRISDNTDSTKKLAFECSGISTATTRTMTVPNENGTISTQDFATAIAIALG